MQTNFRSGILRHQSDLKGSAIFLRLRSGMVDLIVSPDPTIITFIDGDTDYIYTEYSTVLKAWTTATPGCYLYWQMDRVTGLISYQATMVAPITSNVAPTHVNTLLWFDSVSKKWFLSNGSSWVQVLIVQAAYVFDTATLQSASDRTPDFRGTQVGINSTQSAGSLMYDQAGVAYQNSLGQFFTTEDDFIAGVPYGSSMRVEALATYAIAQQTFSKYSVVRFNDFNQIIPANEASQLTQTIGVVEEDVTVVSAPENVGDSPNVEQAGSRVRVVFAGPIANEEWNWSTNGVNAPIYVDRTGQLVDSAPLGQLPVARVIDKQTILFQPWLGTQSASTGGGGGITDHTLLTSIGTNTHNQLDAHVNDVAIHFTEGSIDHTAITNIGTNDHATIDTHLGDGTLHFPKSSILINDLSDVVIGGTQLLAGDVLSWNGTNWINDVATGGGGSGDAIIDADADTSITVEASADEDVIRFNTGNAFAGFPAQTNVITLSSAALTVAMGTAAESNGAPINITAGTGYATEGGDADGGAINITAGDSNNSGAAGSVLITGGVGLASGGEVRIEGGYGNNNGGDGVVQGGYGQQTGGNVRLVPAEGGDGVDSSMGHVEISANNLFSTNVRFQEAHGGVPQTNNNYVSLRAPTSITTNRTWVLPADDPTTAAGDFLTTDASGNLSFAAAGGGGGGATPYDIIAQSIGVPTDGDILTRMVFSRAVTIGAGSPIQHQGYAAIPPSGGTGTISVYKASPPFGGSPSGTLVGTLVFNDGSTSLDSETIQQTSFAVGDLVWFEMTAGNSMGDLTVTLDATAD